jgi:uncharacterized protein YjbI with pentapeptide repeats
MQNRKTREDMSQRTTWGSPPALTRGACLVFAVVVLAGWVISTPHSADAQDLACPQSPSSAPGKDFHGQTLIWANFSHQDLTNANFEGATLTGAVFINANLTGANFRNAVIANSGNATLPTDFSFANLTSACFIGAKFTGPTYFTYATLTCADFSQTDITTNAFFGESPLMFDHQASCRPAFRSATMDCEFVADWAGMELSGANIQACTSQLAGQDFSGTDMTGVDFSGFDLTGSKWQGANLTGAIFTRATLTNADLSGSQLYGAQLNNANLEGANLSGAFLTNNQSAGVTEAANLSGAYLKNVNLSKADLSGTDLSYANFYSTSPVGQRTCDPTKGTCASAAGATLNNTDFSNAYLYGVDFNTATIQGVNFTGAVLIGANFEGATFSVDPKVGTDANFTAAFLQGTNLGKANLDKTNLDQAFVDFRGGGNDMYLLLDSTHTKFAGWPQQGKTVCVFVFYTNPTTVPTANTTLTCPDGSQAGANNPPGCGPTANVPCKQPNAPGTHWNNGVDIAQANPQGSYVSDATYTCAAAPICSPQNSNW